MATRTGYAIKKSKVRSSKLYKETVKWANLMGINKLQYLYALWRDVNKLAADGVFYNLDTPVIVDAFSWSFTYNEDMYNLMYRIQHHKYVQLTEEGLQPRLLEFHIGPIAYKTNYKLALRTYARLSQ